MLILEDGKAQGGQAGAELFLVLAVGGGQLLLYFWILRPALELAQTLLLVKRS